MMSGVITSRTCVVRVSCPSATARTAMSRSVSMPTSRSLSPQTGIGPTSRSRIFRAASWRVLSGRTHSASRVMTLLTCMAGPLSFTVPRLRAVLQSRDAGLLGAVGAAVHRAVVLHAVADHLAAAVAAVRRERVDGALERVERLGAALLGHGERLVVVVPAYVTLRHRLTLPRTGHAAVTRRTRFPAIPLRAARNVPGDIVSRSVCGLT